MESEQNQTSFFFNLLLIGALVNMQFWHKCDLCLECEFL